MTSDGTAKLFTEKQIAEVVALKGEAGRKWTRQVHADVARCSALWGLQVIGRAASGYPTNLTLFVRRGPGEAVLKLGCGDPEQLTEIESLGYYAGRHTVKVLESDVSIPALLLERLRPGTELKSLDDNRRTSEIAAALMVALPQPPPDAHQLPSVADRVQRAFGNFRATFNADDPVRVQLSQFVTMAEAIFPGIVARGGDDHLLHGDLHHENILHDSTRGWLAIDPKGVIGPREFECGRFLHNFMDTLTATEMRDAISERASVIAPVLGIPEAHVLESGLVDMTMGTCWTLETEGDAQPDVSRALLKLELLHDLLH